MPQVSKKHESHIIARMIGMIALIITGAGVLFGAFFLPLDSLLDSKHIPIWFWVLAPLDIFASFKIGLPKTDIRPLLLFFLFPVLTGLYFREGWIVTLGFMYLSPIFVRRFFPKAKDYLFLIRTGKEPEKIVQIPTDKPFEPVIPNYMPNTYKMDSYEFNTLKGIDVVNITYIQPNWDYFIWLKEARSPIPDLEPKKHSIVTQETINGINVKVARLKRKRKGDLLFTELDWDTGGLFFNLRALGVREELVFKIAESLIR
jgi:hypothetical protein